MCIYCPDVMRKTVCVCVWGGGGGVAEGLHCAMQLDEGGSVTKGPSRSIYIDLQITL